VCFTSPAAFVTRATPQQLQQTAAGRIVLASVVDPQNRALVAVGPDDFVVTENGQSREVLDVQVADYPVVVVLDDTAAEPERLAAMKDAVLRFVRRIGERPVALAVLSKPEGFIASFDDERAQLLGTIEAIRGGDAPALPVGALSQAARSLKQLGVPFSAIVVVTARTVGTSAEVAPAVVADILDSGANIQVVIARGSNESADAARTDLLRVLAGQTRGQYTPIFSPASYTIALERIADRMATELMIQYVAPAGSTPGDVKIGARLPGARVVGLGVR
jgi:sarcosine oxidase gamma subunit